MRAPAPRLLLWLSYRQVAQWTPVYEVRLGKWRVWDYARGRLIGEPQGAPGYLVRTDLAWYLSSVSWSGRAGARLPVAGILDVAVVRSDDGPVVLIEGAHTLDPLRGDRGDMVVELLVRDDASAAHIAELVRRDAGLEDGDGVPSREWEARIASRSTRIREALDDYLRMVQGGRG